MAIRLMIVDDAPEVRQLIRRHFERIGCEVVAEATDGAQALRLFADVNPDLVTLDVVMPHTSDIDALTAFSEMRRIAPSTPIVVITSAASASVRGLFSEALFIIEKPFSNHTMRELQRRIELRSPELAEKRWDIRRVARR